MTVTLNGFSGIDTATLVSQLVSASRAPITAATTKKAQVDSASQTITSFSSKLSTLKSAALALSTVVGYGSYAASSSDTAVVASASGSAQAGSYTVSVSQIAKNQKTRSDATTSSTAALGMAGRFEVRVGTSDPVAIDVTVNDSLSDIATKVTGSGARVTASILSDGAGYRLILQGSDTGASNAFTVDEFGTSLGLTAANTYQSAQDAKLRIDDIDITRPSNQITGAISGVTLAITKPTTADATVSVSSDTTQLKQKITTLVNAYNDVVRVGHTAAGYGGSKAQNTVLAGDSAIRSALHRLGSVMSSAVAGASSSLRTLGSAGLSLGNEGTISFDTSKFDAAIAKDPAAVRALFVTDATLGTTGGMKSLMAAVDAVTIGDGAPIKTRLTALSAQSKRLGDSVDTMQERLDAYELQLKKQFTTMDTQMSKYQAMQSALGAIKTSG